MRSSATSRPTATRGAVEQRAGRIEGDLAALLTRPARPALRVCVLHRVDRMERQALTVLLDPGRSAIFEERVGDGDDAPGEKALVELPVGAVDRHGGVAP